MTNEPIVVHPFSAVRRLQEMVWRNRLAFGVAGAVCAAILIDLMDLTWIFLLDKKARRLTAREVKRSPQVALDKSGSVGTGV